MAENQSPSGPDLTQGVPVTALDGGKLLGHVGEQDVLLLRVADEMFAIDALCSHYHGPLIEGLVVGNTVRCPWHHACFDLRSGEAIRAPALSPCRAGESIREMGRSSYRTNATTQTGTATYSRPRRRRSSSLVAVRLVLLRRKCFDGVIIRAALSC